MLGPPAEDWGERDYAGEAAAVLREGRDYPAKQRERLFESWNVTCPICDYKFGTARAGKGTVRGAVELDGRETFVAGNDHLFRYWMCPACNFCDKAETFENRRASGVTNLKGCAPPKRYASYFDIPYSEILRRAEQWLIAQKKSDAELADFYLYGVWVATECANDQAARYYRSMARARFLDAYHFEPTAQSAFLAAELMRQLGDAHGAESWHTVAEGHPAPPELKARIAKCRDLVRGMKP